MFGMASLTRMEILPRLMLRIALIQRRGVQAVRDIEAASPDFQIAKVLLATHKYDECIARFLDHLEAYYEGTADSDEVADVYHPLGLAQGKLGKYRESASSLKKGKYCVLALRVWS